MGKSPHLVLGNDAAFDRWLAVPLIRTRAGLIGRPEGRDVIGLPVIGQAVRRGNPR